MTKGLIFSGIQPTGNLHLGNYLGAIKNWVKLQDNYNCIYCVVDMHAITMPQNPDELRDNTRETLAAFIACGVDPESSILFNQSAVSGHAELAWILNCHTPLGWLNRMTQFKEKAGKHREQAVLGLYGYPVLMAADVILYKATHVPVGDDQKQHVEVMRDIAGSFNHHYNQDFFPIPEPVIPEDGARIMSLRDGTDKMSKSAESDMSRINLTDDADLIAKKFKKAKADMDFDGISYDKEKRPEISNMLTIYAALADRTIKDVAEEFKDFGNGDFKTAMADIAVEKLAPISSEMKKLMDDKDYLDGIMKKGAEKASEIAEKNLNEIKDIVGFLRV